jgi:hypothetical protein
MVINIHAISYIGGTGENSWKHDLDAEQGSKNWMQN